VSWTRLFQGLGPSFPAERMPEPNNATITKVNMLS
jgi:hypothetical protein